VLREHLQKARAFIFAAEEDFGIAPLEAQACGTPVIAFGKGGALETIRGLGVDKKPTGVFFRQQTPESLEQAVVQFELECNLISFQDCIDNAHTFNDKQFKENFEKFVLKKYQAWKN